MTSSEQFYVIAIELDSGVLFIANKAISLGSDQVLPAALQIGSVTEQCGVQVERQALPDYTQQDFWINREAAVIEVSPNSGSVYNGEILLDGIIESEPSEQSGVLNLTLVERKKKLITLPDTGEITSTEFPNAPDDSLGEIKPLIFGTVEEAELIPVELQKSTSLKIDIGDTDQSIDVADATQLAASGSVTIDGTDYSYSSKTDNQLLGMTISQFHRSGTLVAQAGTSKYLAAGHAVTAINTVKADGEITTDGTEDIATATLVFDQLPSINEIKGAENVIAEFDEIDGSDSATLSINAIRAVTATDSNISADALPFAMNTGATELTRNGVVDFPPPTQDRIIKGAYSVTFTINHNGNTGNAEVKIGGKIVWVLNGGAVVFNNSPAVFFYHELTNQLPVSIARDSLSGSIDLSISTALRTISLGNLDNALYGQIANGEQFVANQTTLMPNRGVIKKAQLAIEWFTTDEATGNAQVYFDDVLLGALNADNLAGQTVSENITVDIISQGNAQLLSNDINKSFSGGLASLSNVFSTFIESLAVSPVFKENFGIGAYDSYLYITPPKSAASAIHAVTVFFGPGTSTSDGAVLEINGTTEHGFTPVANGSQTKNIAILSTSTVEFRHINVGSAMGTPSDAVMAVSIRIEWVINQITQANTPTYQSVTQSNRTLPNSGITTSHSGEGQSIDITIPAPPRTVVNAFTLPSAVLEQWNYFTSKQCKISYTSAGAEKVALVRAVLLIDYDVVINKPAQSITANVTGKSANPADVLQFLADVSSQKLNQATINRIKNWADLNAIFFSRRLTQKTDTLTLLSRAAMQINANLYGNETLDIIRWFDRSSLVTKIDEDDLLSAASISWQSDIYNAISVKYREHNGNGFTRIVQADESNNNDCILSQSVIREKRLIEVQAGFIADDDTANQFLADYAKRNAPLHQIISLELPFTYDLKAGDLIDYQDCFYRVTVLSTDNGWISLSAEVIV